MHVCFKSENRLCDQHNKTCLSCPQIFPYDTARNEGEGRRFRKLFIMTRRAHCNMARNIVRNKIAACVLSSSLDLGIIACNAGRNSVRVDTRCNLEIARNGALCFRALKLLLMA